MHVFKKKIESAESVVAYKEQTKNILSKFLT